MYWVYTRPEVVYGTGAPNRAAGGGGQPGPGVSVRVRVRFRIMRTRVRATYRPHACARTFVGTNKRTLWVLPWKFIPWGRYY
jgi:hypothetical protein